MEWEKKKVRSAYLLSLDAKKSEGKPINKPNTRVKLL